MAALRAGSTTSWSAWSVSGGTASATARDVPGAQQLELLRRVNLAQRSGADATPPPVRLVERILTASAAGRGTPDLELLGAVEDRSWGPRPVDPGVLSDTELLRFAATLLAEDLVAADRQNQGRTRRLTSVTRLPHRVRRLSRAGRGHRIVGDPWLALTIRDEMQRRGRPLDGPRSTVVVVGRDAAAMLVDAFTSRAFDGGVASWERWLGSGGSLPRGADLTVVARRWSDATGPTRVVVVPDPALVPRALRLPARARGRLTTSRPSADAVDLARRLAAPLGLLVLPEVRRRQLRRVFLPRLLADNVLHPAAPLAVPDSHLPWVVRRAERMRDDLREAGYPVVGDLQSLVPGPGADGSQGVSGTSPSDAGVLALAVRLLVEGPQAEAAQAAAPQSAAKQTQEGED